MSGTRRRGVALRAGGRRSWLGVEEPSSRPGHARPGTVVGGRVAALRIRGPRCGDRVGFWLARPRHQEAGRDGPGRHSIVRLFPAEQAGVLPFVRLEGVSVTILVRLVTLCIHSRPQSRHISGINRSAPILTLTRPYGISRGLMLPIESERVQRAIFRIMPDYCRDR